MMPVKRNIKKNIRIAELVGLAKRLYKCLIKTQQKHTTDSISEVTCFIREAFQHVEELKFKLETIEDPLPLTRETKIISKSDIADLDVKKNIHKAHVLKMESEKRLSEIEVSQKLNKMHLNLQAAGRDIEKAVQEKESLKRH